MPIESKLIFQQMDFFQQLTKTTQPHFCAWNCPSACQPKTGTCQILKTSVGNKLSSSSTNVFVIWLTCILFQNKRGQNWSSVGAQQHSMLYVEQQYVSFFVNPVAYADRMTQVMIGSWIALKQSHMFDCAAWLKVLCSTKLRFWHYLLLFQLLWSKDKSNLRLEIPPYKVGPVLCESKLVPQWQLFHFPLCNCTCFLYCFFATRGKMGTQKTKKTNCKLNFQT